MMNANDTRSPDDLTAETRKTRADIEETLEALEHRLSASELLEQIGHALAPARDGTVRFAQNLSSTVRDNPVPAALIGIGLGWLLISGRRHDGHDDYDEYAYETGIGEEPYRSDPSRPVEATAVGDVPGDVGVSREEARVRRARAWARERGKEASERARKARERVAGAADSAYRRSSDAVHRAEAEAANRAGAVGNFVQRRPVLTGVAIAGLGAIIATAAFARTDRGRAVTARASHAVREGAHRAGESVREGAHRAGESVRAAAAGVSEKAGHARKDAGDRVHDAVEKAKERADRVREETRSGEKSGEMPVAETGPTTAAPAQPIDAAAGAGTSEQEAVKDPAAVQPGAKPGSTMDSKPVSPGPKLP